MRYLLVFLAFVLFPTTLSADVYRYTDDSGKTHYVTKRESVPERYRQQLENAKPLPGITKVKQHVHPSVVRSNRETIDRYKKVEVFVADWCPHCRNMEKFLKSKDIRYKRIDVDTRRGKEKFAELGGGGIPTVRIGKKVIRGYKPESIMRALGK